MWSFSSSLFPPELLETEVHGVKLTVFILCLSQQSLKVAPYICWVCSSPYSGVALFSYLHLSHSGFSCIILPSSYYGLSRQMHSKSGPHVTGSGRFLTTFLKTEVEEVLASALAPLISGDPSGISRRPITFLSQLKMNYEARRRSKEETDFPNVFNQSSDASLPIRGKWLISEHDCRRARPLVSSPGVRKCLSVTCCC